ncbi:MAG: methyltransferase domain-containing protein [Pseudomonadales bacterium]|jgi:phospholipid N-methyltransferase
MTSFPIVGELWFFFSRFLRRPGNVAAICPSSRYLRRKMFLDLDLHEGDVVLELGPGTGSFTREIETLIKAGLPVRYLGIERDEAMLRFLTRRFPGLEFAGGDILDIRTICREHELPPASVVICGVPLMLMNGPTLRQVLTDIRECMTEDGTFRAFSYVHCYPTRRASTLRVSVRDAFQREFGISSVLRNMPPAIVLTGAKQAEAAGS